MLLYRRLTKLARDFAGAYSQQELMAPSSVELYKEISAASCGSPVRTFQGPTPSRSSQSMPRRSLKLSRRTKRHGNRTDQAPYLLKRITQESLAATRGRLGLLISSSWLKTCRQRTTIPVSLSLAASGVLRAILLSP